MVHRGLGNQLNQLLNRMVVGHQTATRKALDRGSLKNTWKAQESSEGNQMDLMLQIAVTRKALKVEIRSTK